MKKFGVIVPNSFETLEEVIKENAIKQNCFESLKDVEPLVIDLNRKKVKF